MNQLSRTFQARLDQRRNQRNYRVLKASPLGCIDFVSNDYLGFLHDGILDALMQDIFGVHPWGAVGSRLLSGNTVDCERLEREIACFHQEQTGLIFNSGYAANLGLLSAVLLPGDVLIYDHAVHASLHDSVRLSRARALPFRHQDLEHLHRRLEQTRGRVYVCVESVYSCDGSFADLSRIHRLCSQAGAHLIVDEAHATGWLGKSGC